MTSEHFEAFFLDTAAGRTFTLLAAPPNAKSCVLFVPPFAEEMNKSRRQFVETSSALNKKGFATLIVDLFGTGDSEGEFVDANWQAWKENLLSAISWANNRGFQIDTLIAARLGCLLAADVLNSSESKIRKTVFWQPIISGSQFMTQFLRLRVAASMMENDNNESVAGLKGRLGNGETLEIAGYQLSPNLWDEVESIDLLQYLNENMGQLFVGEVGRIREGGLSPIGKRVVEAAEQAGIHVQCHRVEGDPFWSATEVVTNSPLIQLTSDFVELDVLP